MKKLFICFILSTIATFAQNKMVYDSLLASKLGADDYGMKRYVFVLLKTGTNTISSKTIKDSIFKGHFENMTRLEKEGILVLAGPFLKSTQNYRGLFIFNVATLNEAEKITLTDPAVKAGLLDAECIEWYGSASIMLVNEFHERIQKKQIE